jgi:hypothetical protein
MEPVSTNDEVVLVARGIATAVAPDEGLTPVQVRLLASIADALTGVTVDYASLEPLDATDLAAVLASHELGYRQRIVHHMVLAELVLRPLPESVAQRVELYADALGVHDNFVTVAREFALGAYDLAWSDLRRSGFVQHDTTDDSMGDPFEPAPLDPALAARWEAFRVLPAGSLGRTVWEFYTGRGFSFPGQPGSSPEFLTRHDFVHVLADYGTSLNGEMEVFAFIGRADPDPKGFAWLATMTGLFETGYIADAGYFKSDTTERHVQASGMNHRIADAIRRGKYVAEHFGRDLFEIDYYQYTAHPVTEVRELLQIPPKSPAALEAGSAGAFDLEGMSDKQRAVVRERLSLS